MATLSHTKTIDFEIQDEAGKRVIKSKLQFELTNST